MAVGSGVMKMNRNGRYENEQERMHDGLLEAVSSAFDKHYADH